MKRLHLPSFLTGDPGDECDGLRGLRVVPFNLEPVSERPTGGGSIPPPQPAQDIHSVPVIAAPDLDAIFICKAMGAEGAIAPCGGWMRYDGRIFVCQYCGSKVTWKFAVAAGLERANPKLREGDQQLPTVNDHKDIQSQVIADIEKRRLVGIERYGTALQPFNGRDALQDLYEELIDASMYVKQAIVERDARQVQADARAEFLRGTAERRF